jgi:catechol 2,3-dioxygenase-like lactoylglutathione lyase family enzyme
MKYICPLLSVRDLERSREFYQRVLGLEVINDFGANITLTGGVSLQTLPTWAGFLLKPEADIVFGHHAGELYFEEDDFDAFAEKLASMSVELVHPVREHDWGQRVVRFYDPDHHVIEVGENIVTVVKRFIDSGMTAAETAHRMNVPEQFINRCLTGML